MNSDLAGKRLLVMGGTRISCEIIKRAKKYGIFVGVADYNTIEQSPGKKIADAAYDVDACDVNKMSELVRREKYDGLLCGFADVLLPFYADICESVGLPAYGTREQFETFINKDRYKALCRQFDIPTIEGYEMKNGEEVPENLAILLPVLVKPADNSGSRGIKICNNWDEVSIAVENAKKHSKSGHVLVERYLSGKEVTVFWLFKDGKHYLTAIGNRHIKSNQNGVIPLPVGYTFPASVTEKYINEIKPRVLKMFEYVGIQNGMMFMQCKVEKDTCVVYDIGYRLTGSLEYAILDTICGYNPLDMMIRYAITGSMGEELIENKVDPFFHGTYGYNVSILSTTGIIEKILGCDKVMQQPGTIDVVKAHVPGEEITEEMRGLLSQITVRILGTAQSINDMKRRMRAAYDTIHIIGQYGQELKLSGLEEADFKNVLK